MTIDSRYIQIFKMKLLELKPIQKIDSEPEKAVKEQEGERNELTNLAIQAVDAMDLIYQSALKTDFKEWGGQIETVITEFLKLLESYGIEEIKVLGHLINEETMTSIGTIPESFQEELQKFQVYTVLERGFRHKDNGELIREAKVITIY